MGDYISNSKAFVGLDIISFFMVGLLVYYSALVCSLFFNHHFLQCARDIMLFSVLMKKQYVGQSFL